MTICGRQRVDMTLKYCILEDIFSLYVNKHVSKDYKILSLDLNSVLIPYFRLICISITFVRFHACASGVIKNRYWYRTVLKLGLYLF